MTEQDAVSFSPEPTDQDKARAFHTHFCAMYEAVGRPLTDAQKEHSKRWIWSAMKKHHAKPMFIAPDSVYRHPEDFDAD